MKKIIIQILLSIAFTLSIYAQPTVTNTIGTVSKSKVYTLQRTAANAANTYCISFTLSESFKVNVNPNGTALTFSGYFVLPSTTMNPAIKFNEVITLAKGEYRFYIVNSQNLAFKLDITFTSTVITTTSSETIPTTTSNIAATGVNYIRTTTPLIEKSAVTYNTAEEMVSFKYFDGLGRPTGTVQQGITPAKSDLAVLQEYDEYGRESNTWLPVAIASNNGAFAGLVKVKANINAAYPSDAAPYSKPVYEFSPLNRIQQQYGPGADWQTNKKAVYTGLTANIAKSGTAWADADSLVCARYISTDEKKTVSIYRTDNYAANELIVARLKDENGNVSYEFKNKLGQVILTRQINAGKSFDTNYIYDNYGNLRVVLPPEASAKLLSAASTAAWTDTNADIKAYAYLYKYDSRNRCIAKKIPGCEPIYYVYDKADRLIFTQDGENRKASLWQFAIPDAFGRIVLAGTCKNTFNYAANPLKAVVVKGTYNTARTTPANSYTITGVALTTPVILSANYYDDYAFMGMTGIPNDANTQYAAETGYGIRYTGGYKGLLTGTLTAQITTTGAISATYLYSVMYYDNRGRLIQTKSNNPLAGGLEKEYIAYNFAGQPTLKKHIHSATGKTTQTEVYAYTYDHAGRLTKETHQLNAGTIITLAENTYDELGRQKTNKKGGVANALSTYTYNVRSWTKSITSSLFTQTLYYNETYGGSVKQYNGNISAMSWKHNTETNTRGYAFTYDNLSRLTAASYLVNAAANTNFKTAYTYDKHGNMLTLQRYGKTAASTYGLIDNLTMTYAGNQLLTANDAVANISLAESADFKNYSAVATEYTYNANGAMVKDFNKGITDIQYNSLNLPRQMDIKSPVAEARNEYTYSAGGQKLKVVQKWNPSFSTAPVIGSAINTALLTMTKTTEYVGNIIYENAALKRILVDGGYIEGGVYYYNINDHLGNNCVVIRADGTIIQRNHYYPFGTAFAENTVAEQGRQPYKYNGKELDQMHGVNLYDYSARYKDDFRFTSVDPLAEKYYSISPYVYVENNPLKYIDPTGKEKLNGLYGKDPKDPALVEVRRSVDNDMIHIYAHGLGADRMTFIDFFGKETRISNKTELMRFLSEYSDVWKTRELGQQIIIVLHACNSGNENIGIASLADLLSMDMPDYVTIVAPSNLLNIEYDGENIRKNGVWNVYNQGNKVTSFGGATGNNPDLLPYQSNSSTASNDNKNNKEQSQNENPSTPLWWTNKRREFYEEYGF